MKNAERIDVAIIGSGVAGLGLAIKLRESGREDFLVFERDSEVGGTWWVNTYPGCACDVPSHLYSYSFASNPHWSRTYSPQPEIGAYLRDCAERWKLRDRIRLNTEIVESRFDEGSARWLLTDASGRQYSARILIGAVGGLSRAQFPDIPGIDSFKGPSFHSQQWNHEVDLDGKTVAVLGSGASAVQFVPEIAPTVKHLRLFQRTAPWVVPRLDRDYTAFEHWLFRRVPAVRKLLRLFIYLACETLGAAIRRHNRFMTLLEHGARRHIRKGIPDDEALREKVTPRFSMGCKRMLYSNSWYPALARDNVTVHATGVREITASGVIDAEGNAHDVDVIIYGTGFHATDLVQRGQIIGRDGLDLIDRWADSGQEGYWGTTVSGFPNMFIIPGPNTGQGHTSMFYMIESIITYVMDAIRKMDLGDIRTVEVRKEVEADFNRRLQEKMATTVWQTGGCNSWYQDASGKNTALWPEPTWRFRRGTRTFRLADYITTAA